MTEHPEQPVDPYIGTEPGEWMEMNPSAAELFGEVIDDGEE